MYAPELRFALGAPYLHGWYEENHTQKVYHFPPDGHATESQALKHTQNIGKTLFLGIGGAPQSVLLSAINPMIKYPTERGKFFHMGLQIVNGLTSDLWFWGYRVVVSSDIGGMGLMKVRQRWFFFNKVQSASQSVSLESRIWSAKP